MTKQLAIELEAYATPQWAVDAILRKEILTHVVIDPCVGRGVMAEAAILLGGEVYTTDIHDWGYYISPSLGLKDFRDLDPHFVIGGRDEDWTLFVNPPFSLATEMVEWGFRHGARKIVMFQRWSFFEAKKRREFWQQYPANRIYICADRASCWRFDIPEAEQKSGTTTAHAWFVWEPAHPAGTLVGEISKDG